MRAGQIRILFCAALCACAASCRSPDVHCGSKNIPEDWNLGRCHTFDKIVGAKEFFESHSEYFALRGGKRLGKKTQPCLTNPEVLRIAKERVVKRVLESPKAKFFGVSQNDNGNYCTCPDCAAVDEEEGSHAGTVVRFVNAIAAEVAKVRKDAVVTTLAYMYSRKPPKTPLAPNAAVWLCTTDVDFSRPLDGGGNENDAFMADLRGWKAKAPMGVYVWDYSKNFRHVHMPFPDLRAIAENFRVYRESGVKGVYLQGAEPGTLAPFRELKTFLSSRVFWDPCASPDELVREFTDRFYGKAAGAKVREIIDFLEGIPKTIVRFDESIYARWLDDAAIEKLDAMWREAECLAAGNPEHEFNARMGRLSPVYSRFARAVCRMTKRVWLCASPQEYCRKEEALADLKWIHSLMDEAKAKKKGQIVFTEMERHTKLAGRWSFALTKPFPGKGADALTIPLSYFAADGESGAYGCGLDDFAFDGGTDFSIVLRGLGGASAGIRDLCTGKELASAAACSDGGLELRLLSPIPVLGAFLWLGAMPPGDVELLVVRNGENGRPAKTDRKPKEEDDVQKT